MSATFEVVMAETRRNRRDFVCEHVPSVEELGRRRMTAMRRFLRDYPAGLAERRYVAAALPALPFADRSFDLDLRFRDPMTGQNILTLTESNEERHRAEDEREQEKYARQQAEDARQQAERARQQAEQAQQQEKQARQRAEQACLVAEARLERELARVAELQATLAQRQKHAPEREGRAP